MPRGRVEYYDQERGFGFIDNSPRDSDIFFHVSDFEGNGTLPSSGDKVDFTIAEGKKGVVAKNVRLVR